MDCLLVLSVRTGRSKINVAKAPPNQPIQEMYDLCGYNLNAYDKLDQYNLEEVQV